MTLKRLRDHLRPRKMTLHQVIEELERRHPALLLLTALFSALLIVLGATLLKNGC